MKPLWLLEKDIFLENHDKLYQAIKDCGLNYQLCQYIPFGSGFQTLNSPNGELDHPLIFFYGSLQLGRWLINNTNYEVYLNLPQFKCSYYYPRFGKYLFNSDYVMLPYGDLLRRGLELFNYFGALDKIEQIFIRPDSGFKIFTGQAVSKYNWEAGIEHLGFYDVQPEELVVLSSMKVVDKEWRFVIGTEPETLKQYVVTGSVYGVEKEEISPYVFNYVNDVLKNIEYHPDPFWTLDVCFSGGKYHVMEVGSLSCAGLYFCDLKLIIEKVSEYLEWKFSDSI